jgi:hypothetical protein
MFSKISRSLLVPLSVLFLLSGSPLIAQAPPTDARASKAHEPYLPDPKLTPGQAMPGWTRDMTKGGTRQYRHVSEKLKRDVWALYGYDKTIGPYDVRHKNHEFDHLIPVCLGGTSTAENIWPQPYEGRWNAHMKDKLEMRVRARVLRGEIPIDRAQRMFTSNWIDAYKNEGLPDPKN